MICNFHITLPPRHQEWYLIYMSTWCGWHVWHYPFAPKSQFTIQSPYLNSLTFVKLIPCSSLSDGGSSCFSLVAGGSGAIPVHLDSQSESTFLLRPDCRGFEERPGYIIYHDDLEVVSYFARMVAASCMRHRRASSGGVPANMPSIASLLNSFPTNRLLYTGFRSSPLLMSIHRVFYHFPPFRLSFFPGYLGVCPFDLHILDLLGSRLDHLTCI